MSNFDRMMGELDVILTREADMPSIGEESEELSEKYLPVADGYNVKVFKKGGRWSYGIYDGEAMVDKGSDGDLGRAMRMAAAALVELAGDDA